jgi:hypothetical protein
MKIIKLTQGKLAIVDDEDYVRLSKHKWQFNKGYAVRSVKVGGKSVKEHMHRVVLRVRDSSLVDHINRNPLDNRKCNLRLATHKQNSINSYNPRGASGYKGVSKYNCSKWQVYVGSRYIGLFSNKEDAAVAYNSAAKEVYGKFAALNNLRSEV